mmetsp:Transcript_39553/g.54918  ORF Transcript_39553/g.54918 Transcript_39553/m.54918 type:complete len:807 (+) Transcript_39553:102-2522(+)|eukprot:CAMPEP_0196589322 /NCGR_PEP_ID=MMETSP1081-20130531/63252_1 /TAXON_ID=36882 /ORGANISM="Pyramimonas amylifera, Strain CCMP720" /LENGTH=806 /DNA_ID=CAMNT_0041912089 /DNA_START=98 /DNA_END=2518 /DNA_ORIENTATION=+
MSSGTGLIVGLGCVGIAFAVFLFTQLKKIALHKDSYGDANEGDGYILEGLLGATEEGRGNSMKACFQRLRQIHRDIRDGAKSFLHAEYKMCAMFVVLFGAVVLGLVSHVDSTKWDFKVGALTAISFAVGGFTSMLAGYIGMMVAVFANARTTVCATESPDSVAWTGSFNCAFRAGGVMGFALTGLALLVLYSLINIYALYFDFTTEANHLFECIAGFGLGGSSIALFGRVGGGIYTKAADVGADLAGKVVAGIPEDDPRNPATIADNVGDNVGDVAGMGADLFGSFGEATCAALVIAGQSKDLVTAGWDALMFPLYISAVGILVCLVTSFVATDLQPVRAEKDVEKVLKVQLGLSTALMTVAMYPICITYLPHDIYFGDGTFASVCSNLVELPAACVKNAPLSAYICVVSGLWGGCLIGFVTEYFTSHSYNPVREVARSTETGAATNIIYGLALGYKSTIIPVTVLAIIVYLSFSSMDMYGVALAALGMLGTLATCLTIDVYGPVCDNAGGIAEMSELPEQVREKTDALDAAGNTTAAIGKGFAIGSAALVSLALTSAFVKRTEVLESGVNMLHPMTFAFLLIGSMLPYWFSAMTMKSVGLAAMAMVKEVKRQFETIPGLLEGTPGHGPPDHAQCIKISTEASLREMIAPGVLVMASPIITGTLFGVQAVVGLLAGGMVSGVQLAISASNTGGAWDNAKKFVERGDLSIDVCKRHPAPSDPAGGPYTGEFVRRNDGSVEMVSVKQKKGSECHKAAVIGDTVGDPLKDTSGPALNILMKLMAIISLVFCDFFMSINNGKGFLNISRE